MGVKTCPRDCMNAARRSETIAPRMQMRAKTRRMSVLPRLALAAVALCASAAAKAAEVTSLRLVVTTGRDDLRARAPLHYASEVDFRVVPPGFNREKDCRTLAAPTARLVGDRATNSGGRARAVISLPPGTQDRDIGGICVNFRENVGGFVTGDNWDVADISAKLRFASGAVRPMRIFTVSRTRFAGGPLFRLTTDQPAVIVLLDLQPR